MRVFAFEDLIIIPGVLLQTFYNLANACAIGFDIIVTIGMSTPISLPST
jgi:hypothetical protein